VTSVCEPINWVAIYATCSGPALDSDSDISVFTPGRAPWVADQEILLAILRPISDGCHCMVKVCSRAGTGWKDTRVIVHKVGLVCLHSYCDCSLTQSCLQLGRIVLRYIAVICHMYTTKLLGSLTVACLTGGAWSVGIAWLWVLWFGLEVIEGKTHVTAIASIISCRAVD